MHVYKPVSRKPLMLITYRASKTPEIFPHREHLIIIIIISFSLKKKRT